MQITDHEPTSLWKHFDRIRQIPRCSGNEEQARQYVLAWAKERGYESGHDDTGNAVVRVPATPGCENARLVAIQSHLDMVCEKNSNVDHDFSKDPIELQIDGEWLTANGTTLGADNGVGVAAALATADDESVVHGPLELLFTVDEEVGLTGAGKLAPGFVTAKRLLNLDSEELGSVFIGCAGGGDSTLTLPVERAAVPSGHSAVRLAVSGLRGGHSGLDIPEQRGNAVKILSRILWEADRKYTTSLCGLRGGNKRNAIPREAAAELWIKDGETDDFAKWIGQIKSVIAGELGGREKGLEVKLDGLGDSPGDPMSPASQRTLLNLIMAIPHGVTAMSYDIPDLVETSNNLATVATSERDVVIGTSSRSSINSALQSMRDGIRGAGELAGAKVDEEDPYPGWKPNLDSELLKITKRVHKEALGKEPEALAIHAGLECGIIGEKFPGMDMISFGPNIEHPHSPDERIHIPSVARFWSLLTALLGALTKE